MLISLLFPVVIVNVILLFKNKIYNCICIDTRNIHSVMPYKLKADYLRDHADYRTKYMLARVLFGPKLSAHNSF